MSSPFVAEIRLFACNFAPVGWALCNGQLLPISQNTALFSLLGTFYGGDGKSTFALPNLQDRVPIHQGQGPGLSDRFIGEESGSDNVTLIQTEMPQHMHNLNARAAASQTGVSNGAVLANGAWVQGSQFGVVQQYGSTAAAGGTAVANGTMSQSALQIVGSSFPHNNMMPYLVLNYCIALQGVFPPRG